MLNTDKVRDALRSILDPELGKNLVELGMIKDIRVDSGKVNLTLALTTLRCPRKKQLVGEIKKVVGEIPGVTIVDVQVSELSDDERKRLFPKHPLVGIKKVGQALAVASGKGGVGKTTVAVNVALALAGEGKRVGLLDADVYGPSIPLMLGLSQKPVVENGMLIPLEKFGLKIISFGMLMEEGQPVIWRGPLVGRAIKQLLGEVMWGELDYLVVDLPPGTGDPSITVAQALPEVQILMVTTPQEASLVDVRRSVELFVKFKRKILGFIENMSYFLPNDSAEPIAIFGQGGGDTLSRETGLPLLGSIPIDLEISRAGDSGEPLLVSSAASSAAKIFRDVARKIIKRADGPKSC